MALRLSDLIELAKKKTRDLTDKIGQMARPALDALNRGVQVNRTPTPPVQPMRVLQNYQLPKLEPIKKAVVQKIEPKPLPVKKSIVTVAEKPKPKPTIQKTAEQALGVLGKVFGQDNMNVFGANTAYAPAVGEDTKTKPKKAFEKFTEAEKKALPRIFNAIEAPVAGAVKGAIKDVKTKGIRSTPSLAALTGAYKGVKENTSLIDVAQSEFPGSKVALGLALAGSLAIPGPGGWEDDAANIARKSEKYGKVLKDIEDANKARNIFSKYGIELSKEAKPEEITNAFKKAAHIAHPDKGGTDEKFIELTAARDHLLRNKEGIKFEPPKPNEAKTNAPDINLQKAPDVGKVVKPIEFLPKEINVYDEAKAVGAKRIAPDRIPHQQITPEQGINALVEKAKKRADSNANSWIKATDGLQGLINKYGDSIPARTEANLQKYPGLMDDFYKYSSLKKYVHNPKSLVDMKNQFLQRAEKVKWNPEMESAYRGKVTDEYKNLVRADISKGYKYPDEVLNYDKSFKTAVNNRARYEKGLHTSFSADDSRIVFDEQNRIVAGMKRQDGKQLLPAQKQEIIDGVLQTQRALGIDLNKLSKDERWVYAHLNGKNPFLTKNAAGMYRRTGDYASVSLGGSESFDAIVNGEKIRQKVNTTAAHEIGHALDGNLKGKLLDSPTVWELRRTFKPVVNSSREDKYWSSGNEVTARAIEEYVAVKEGHTGLFDREGYWNKEIFESKIKPAVEKSIDTNFAQYKSQLEPAPQPPAENASLMAEEPPQLSPKKEKPTGPEPDLQALNEEANNQIGAIDPNAVKQPTERELVKQELSSLTDFIKNSPIRKLKKYVDPRTGRLPEILGKYTLPDKKKYQLAREFQMKGDQNIEEYGVETEEQLYDAFDSWQNSIKRVKELRDRLKELPSDKLATKKTYAEGYRNAAIYFKAKMRVQLNTLRGRAQAMEIKMGNTFEAKRAAARQRAKETALIKQDIVNYARTHLPLRERGKLLAAVKNARTEKDLLETVNRIDELGESAARRTLTSAIVKELKSAKPKRVNGVIQGKYTADVQKKLNQITELAGMTRAEAQYKIMSSLDDAVDGFLSPDQLIENDMLNMAGLKEQNSNELARTLSNIQALKEHGKTLRELQIFNKEAEIDRYKEGAINEITAGTKKPDLTIGSEPDRNAWQKFTDMQNWLHGLDTLMESWSNKPGQAFTGTLHTLAQKIHTARLESYKSSEQVSQEIQSGFDRAFKTGTKSERKAIVRRNQKVKSLGKFKNADGNTVEIKLSQNEAYKKWMELQDPTLTRTFDEGMHWTDEMKKAVEKYILPDTKKWAEWQLNTFYPQYYKTVNAVFRVKYGVDMPFNPKYSPLFRDGIDTDRTAESLLIQDLRDFLTGKPGSIKSRVKNIRPLKVIDGDSVLMRHITEMEHFKAFEEPLSDLRKVFGDSGIRKALRSNHGPSALKAIDHILLNIARDGRDTANTIHGIDKLRSNFTKSVLGVNPLIALKQFSSVPAFITHMPGSPVSGVTIFFKGAANFWTDPIGNSKILFKSPYIRARYDLGDMERDIRLAMKHGSAAKLTGTTSLSDWMMAAVSLGDKASVLQGGWAVYKANLDNFLKQGMDRATAEQMAMRKFERAVAQTQQSGLPEDMSAIQTTGGSFAKLFSMFITQPQQYLRLAMNYGHDIRVGRGSKSINLRNIALVWIVLPMMFQFVADGFEFRKKRQLRAALMGPLNGIPAFGDAIDTVMRSVTGDDVYGGTGAPSVFSSADEFASGVNSLRKKEVTIEDVYDAIEKFATAAGNVVGAPVGPVLQIGKGIKDTVMKGDPRRLIYSPYALEQKNAPPLLDFSKTNRFETRKEQAAKEKTVKADDAKKRLKPLYEQAQKLKASGDNAGAQQIVDRLSDEDYKVYQSLKTADKNKKATAQQKAMSETVFRVQDLLKNGNKGEAQRVVDAMSDEDYKIYQSTKKLLGY